MIDKTFNIEDLEEVKRQSAQVIELYCNQLMSLTEVASLTKINVNTVRQILLDNNIQLRQRNFRK